MFKPVSENDIHTAVRTLRETVGERYDQALSHGRLEWLVPFSETNRTYRNWQQALLIPLREALGSKRDLRLHVLSAVLGFDIDSTNDLCPAEAGALTSMFEMEDRWPVILGSIGAAVNIWRQRLAYIKVPKRPKVELDNTPPPLPEEDPLAGPDATWEELGRGFVEHEPEYIPM